MNDVERTTKMKNSLGMGCGHPSGVRRELSPFTPVAFLFLESPDLPNSLDGFRTCDLLGPPGRETIVELGNACQTTI